MSSRGNAVYHSLGLMAYIFAAREKIREKIFSREDIFARRYFRWKIFSLEDIFAGRYFRVNSIIGKISSREKISNSLFAIFSSRENKVLYSNRSLIHYSPIHHRSNQMHSAVAQWLQRTADDRKVPGSNPAGTASKLWQFRLLHFASEIRSCRVV